MTSSRPHYCMYYYTIVINTFSHTKHRPLRPRIIHPYGYLSISIKSSKNPCKKQLQKSNCDQPVQNSFVNSISYFTRTEKWIDARVSYTHRIGISPLAPSSPHHRWKRKAYWHVFGSMVKNLKTFWGRFLLDFEPNCFRELGDGKGKGNFRVRGYVRSI